MSDKTKWERCPRCGKLQPNVGPWNDPRSPYKRLCGICKCQETFSRPGAKERFEREMSAALGMPVVMEGIPPTDPKKAN